MSGPAPSMPQIARLLADAYPEAKVPPLVAPAWAVAFLAQHKSEKLGFNLHKFRCARLLLMFACFNTKRQLDHAKSPASGLHVELTVVLCCHVHWSCGAGGIAQLAFQAAGCV